MRLLQRKPKNQPVPPASPVEEAVAAMRDSLARATAAESELKPLRSAQHRAHRAARGGPKAKTDDASLSVAAADYFLGRTGRETVDSALAETAAVESAEASEQQTAALALLELDRRIKPLEAQRDAAVRAYRDAQYRALRCYAEQLDAERRALMQRQADLLANIYAVDDLLSPLVRPEEGLGNIAAPFFMRPRGVEILPTALQPAGQYATFLDDKRLAAAKEQVLTELRMLGALA